MRTPEPMPNYLLTDKFFYRINLRKVLTITTQYPGVYNNAEHENRRYNLLKQTWLIYSILRLKREYNREEKPAKMRKKLSKLILFAIN